MIYTFEKLLEYVRINRNFDVETYLTEKLHKFVYGICLKPGNKTNVDSFVLGISGGIDSAVVFALLDEAKKFWHCNKGMIKKIVPIFMPIYCDSISEQTEARSRAKELVESRGYDFIEIDLSKTYSSVVDSFGENGPKDHVKWANGQMACILRTPALYYQAAILQSEGLRSIVVGTTNRDEGSYIGFFGKASDAMVDLQPIADIHKSEVYTLARHLNIPQSIIDVTPKGDVWDCRNDEQMIGAPYWFLELLIRLREMNEIFLLDEKHLSKEDFKKAKEWTENIEKIHDSNEHKYQVGQPAHFLDVMKRTVENGWK